MPPEDSDFNSTSPPDHWEEPKAATARRSRAESLLAIKIPVETVPAYYVADQEEGLFHLPSPVDQGGPWLESPSPDLGKIEKSSTDTEGSVLVTDEYPRPPLSRHSWQASSSHLPPGNSKINNPHAPQRRSWEPTSMLDIAPVQRRLSHHRGVISLDFSASELARRNELIDYRRALDIISDAGSSPRAPSFPPILGRATPHSDEETTDLKLPPKRVSSRYSVSRAETASQYINAAKSADKSPLDIETTPPDSDTRSNTLDIRGKEAADAASDLHDVCR